MGRTDGTCGTTGTYGTRMRRNREDFFICTHPYLSVPPCGWSDRSDGSDWSDKSEPESCVQSGCRLKTEDFIPDRWDQWDDRDLWDADEA